MKIYGEREREEEEEVMALEEEDGREEYGASEHPL